MSPIHHVAIFNLFAIALALLGSTIYWIGHPRSRKAEGIIVVSCFTFLGSFTIDIVLTILCRVIHVRYDQYIYRIDAFFGQPSFLLGRVLEHHAWLKTASVWAYDLPITAFLLLAVTYYATQPQASVREMFRCILLCLIPAPLEYLLLPVSGPAYAFPGFPNIAPVLQHPHLLSLASPPNGVPSIHMAFALLLWYFARKWKVGFLLGGLLTLFTVTATLGLGEHYLFDLLLALPHSLLAIYLGSDGPAVQPSDPAMEASRLEPQPVAMSQQS